MSRQLLPVLVLATCLAPVSVRAQGSAPAAADAGFEAARKATAALSRDAIAALQDDLIWTGDLNSLATGEFGKRSYEAIRAFRKRQGGTGAGMLTAAERKALTAAAARARTAYGFREVTEKDVTVGYPASLAVKRAEGRNGPKYSAPGDSVTVDILTIPATQETMEALFQRLKTERPGRTVGYSLLRPDFFVVSGLNEGVNFYIRFQRSPTGSSGFVLGWDPLLSPEFDRVAIAMAGSLKLAGAGAAGPIAVPEPEPEPQKPAGPPVPLPSGASTAPRTGPGILVSGEGDILTYASLVAGCMTVSVADGGEGKVVAGDLANDIALVRGGAPASARAVPWRSDALAAGASVQAGTTSASVTALAGQDGDTRRITLSAGGAGGLFDQSGALAGLTAADGSASALKGLFTGAFLRSAGAAATVSSGGTPQTATLNLTCKPGG